jgi:hypothetical protein
MATAAKKKPIGRKPTFGQQPEDDELQKTEKTIVEGDPLGVNRRLYLQLGKLIDDMEAADRDERMTMPQRIQALIAVARVQKMFVDLRKGEFSAGGGSAINRYAAAFQTPHAVGGRDEDGRPRVIVQFDRGPDPDEFDDDRDD